MNIYMSIMSQEFLISTVDEQIISYIQETYSGYICDKISASKALKRIDADYSLKCNSGAEKETIVDNAIVNLVNAHDQYYLLHAGVLLLDDEAFLICGKTKSGKSTACFLLQAKYDYICISDDLAFINKKNLCVTSIYRPVKLRKPVVKKYDLLQEVEFCEYDSEGTERYKLVTKSNDFGRNKKETLVKAIIEIEYVQDENIQSIEEISGCSAIQTLLLNSYSQDRLKDSYGVITELIKNVSIFKVKYNNPMYLNDIIIALSKKGVFNE